MIPSPDKAPSLRLRFRLRHCLSVFSILLPAMGVAEDVAYRIPIQISAPEHHGSEHHVFVGVPYPRGAVTQPGEVGVVDEAGNRVPSTSQVMARWPQLSSVRWMGVEFTGDPAKAYYVVPAGSIKGGGAQVESIKVTETDAGFTINTGPAQYHLKRRGALIGEAWVDHNRDGQFQGSEKVLSNTAGDDLYVVDQEGQTGWAGRDSSSGQLRFETAEDERPAGEPTLTAEFRREGDYLTENGSRMARHITRIKFYAGDANAYIQHQLILTENTHKRWLADYGIRFRYASKVPEGKVAFPKDEGKNSDLLTYRLSPKTPSLHLFQEKAFSFSRMDRETDCRFEIAATDQSGTNVKLHEGALAGNWILAETGNSGVGVALRNLWQLYPKELEATPEGITLRLWSSRGGRDLDFRFDSLKALWPEDWANRAPDALKNRLPKINTDAAGMARTHELILALQPKLDEKAMQTAAARLQTPAIAIVSPQWLRKSEAMGRYHPYDPERFPKEESFMETWFDRLMLVVRDWGDYGFLEFGNWPHIWYSQETSGPREGRWTPSIDRYPGIIDYGFHSHVWRMYSRSGNRKYFDAAEEMIRHRYDICMAHWDALSPEEPLPPRGLRRLRGTYTFSNSPFPWSGGSGFHHNSGTDIRSLSYWHYTTGQRAPKEMIVAYGEAAKRVWNSGNLEHFRATRPFASLKNLATVYQETRDPELLKITLEQLEWLVDLDEPQGISIERETTGYGKYGVKVGAIHRVWEVTEHPLAKASLLRGATTVARGWIGRLPFTYYNTMGEQLSEAAKITGDPLFLRALRRDMALATSHYFDDETQSWKLVDDDPVVSASANVYPLGGMAYAMDAVVNASDRQEASSALIPHARKAGAGPEVSAFAMKEEGEPLTLELKSLHVLAPEVIGPDGAVVTKLDRIPFTDQLNFRKPLATGWLLRIPKHLPAGEYQVRSGAGYLPWEVTWSDAAKLVLHAPRGIIIGSGGRQWANRIMPGTPDHRAPIFFTVPAGTESFEIYSSGRARLRAKNSEKEIPITGGEWQKIASDNNGKETVYALHPVNLQMIKVRGVAPFFAYGDADRLYQPATPIKEPKRIPPPTPLEEGSSFMKVSSPDGLPKGGVRLSGGTRLQFPAAGNWIGEEGTLEFWLLPEWSSSDQFLQKAKIRNILSSDGWELSLHQFGEMSLTAKVQSSKPTTPRSVETHAAANLEEGEWTHIALQWRRSQGAFILELFVNGRPQVATSFSAALPAGMPANAPGFVPKTPQDLWFGARPNGATPLNAVVAGIRFSASPQYDGAFQAALPVLDEKTSMIFPLESDLAPVSKQPDAATPNLIRQQPK